MIRVVSIPMGTDCTFDNIGGEGRAFMARGSLVLRSALVSNTQQRDTNIDYDEDDGAFKFTGVFVSVGSTASVIAEVRRMLL